MTRIVKLASHPTVKGMDGKDTPASGYVHLGGGYYDVDSRVQLPEGATPLASGFKRFVNLPDADKANVMRASVYRSKDGSSLRAKANTAVGASLPAKVPGSGNTSAQPPNPAKAKEVLAKAKEYVQQGTAVQAIVPMSQVLTGDIVETDTIIPHRWLGETDETLVNENPILP